METESSEVCDVCKYIKVCRETGGKLSIKEFSEKLQKQNISWMNEEQIGKYLHRCKLIIWVHQTFGDRAGFPETIQMPEDYLESQFDLKLSEVTKLTHCTSSESLFQILREYTDSPGEQIKLKGRDHIQDSVLTAYQDRDVCPSKLVYCSVVPSTGYMEQEESRFGAVKIKIDWKAFKESFGNTALKYFRVGTKRYIFEHAQMYLLNMPEGGVEKDWDVLHLQNDDSVDLLTSLHRIHPLTEDEVSWRLEQGYSSSYANPEMLFSPELNLKKNWVQIYFVPHICEYTDVSRHCRDCHRFKQYLKAGRIGVLDDTIQRIMPWEGIENSEEIPKVANAVSKLALIKFVSLVEEQERPEFFSFLYGDSRTEIEKLLDKIHSMEELRLALNKIEAI